MQQKLSALFIIVLIFLISCESSKQKKEAVANAKQFFLLLKNGEELKLSENYPGFQNFEKYYKSDSAAITAVEYDKGAITVWVHNRFTNGYGKLTEKDIQLLYKKDSTGKFSIYDSKGLSGFEENDTYVFGVGTGCIDRKIDTTDQQILNAMKKAKVLMLSKAVDVYLDLKTEIKVVSWTWESGYGGSASGKGIVRNGSSFSVPKLKYKITYKDASGNPVTSDDGYVTYDVINSGESKSFSFYTSYVGNASKASIDFNFDEDLIYKYLADKNWTGKEWNEYLQAHPDAMKEL